MHYLKISSMAVRNLLWIKALLIAALFAVFFIPTAHADVLQDCSLKEKNPQDVNDCIVAGEQRSMSELRSLSLRITKKFQTSDDKRGYRAYAMGESNLVRSRDKQCSAAGKSAVKAQMDAVQTRLGCQADFNFAHAQELKRRYPE